MGPVKVRSSAAGATGSKRLLEEDEAGAEESLSTKRVKAKKQATSNPEGQFAADDYYHHMPSTSVTSTSKRGSRRGKSVKSAPQDKNGVDLDALVKSKKKGTNALQNDDDHQNGEDLPTKSKKAGKKKAKEVDEEKRLKRFRENAPNAYWDVHNRAMTQRMFVIERTRSGSEDCPEESVELAGTTGNIYTVHIKRVPACDCPHAQKGHQCKHIVYVMAKVLRAPEHLQYQLALLSSELREILANAPPILSADNTARDGLRKPVEGDCPICCTELEPATEEIVWCKAACGNNVHKDCFGQWAATRKGQAGGVTCPFCRTPWMGDEDMLRRLARSGETNEEGYVNVAGELGISGQRDYSSYHMHWVRRQRRRGVDVGDWMDPDWD